MTPPTSIVAFDPAYGKHIGYAIRYLDPDTKRVKWQTGTLVDADHVQDLLKHCKTLDVHHAICEDQYVSVNPKVSQELSAVRGDILGQCRRAGFQTDSVKPVHWKRAMFKVNGHYVDDKKLQKKLAFALANELTKTKVLTDDEAEACCMIEYWRLKHNGLVD